jgi:hypothetical protein
MYVCKLVWHIVLKIEVVMHVQLYMVKDSFALMLEGAGLW